MKGGATHTNFRRGKRVNVILMDGKKFVAKFDEKRSKHITFLDHEPVKNSELRSVTIYRNQPQL